MVGNVCEICSCGHFVGDPCFAKCRSDTCPNARGKIGAEERRGERRAKNRGIIARRVSHIHAYTTRHRIATADRRTTPGSPEDRRLQGERMRTTRDDLREWFRAGVKMGATHMVVVCDTFDYEDYPVFVNPDQDVARICENRHGNNMAKVMEVYDLALNEDEQIAEDRSWHGWRP